MLNLVVTFKTLLKSIDQFFSDYNYNKSKKIYLSKRPRRLLAYGDRLPTRDSLYDRTN